MLSQLYSLSFYIAWRMERNQNPVLKRLSEKTKSLIKKQLDIQLERPLFSKKITPDDGNPCIKKFRKTLENFKFENDTIRVTMRDTFSVENFAIEDKEKFVIGQYLLHFEIYNKSPETSADNFSPIQVFLLNKIREIEVQTDRAIIKVTGSRCHGEVKQHSELWPKTGSTEF